MEHSLFAVRASIVSAMEYLASARLEVPCAAPGGAASIYRAETLLRRALGGLPEEVDGTPERRNAAHLQAERGAPWPRPERRRA